MSRDITVVSVELIPGPMWRVQFSEPVHHKDYIGRSTYWHIRKSKAPDELAAYLWGQGVIQAHTRRVAEEQSNADR